MVKLGPLSPMPSPPLSPIDREQLTDADRDKIDAWQFRLHGYTPTEADFIRLYLLGKRSAK